LVRRAWLFRRSSSSTDTTGRLVRRGSARDHRVTAVREKEMRSTLGDVTGRSRPSRPGLARGST
jgi:hypothetical protein